MGTVAGLALGLLLGVVVFVPGTQSAQAAPNTFFTVSDGVNIAMNVRLPDNYVPGQTYPTLFEINGYDGGSAEDGTLSKDFAEATSTTFFPLQEDSR